MPFNTSPSNCIPITRWLRYVVYTECKKGSIWGGTCLLTHLYLVLILISTVVERNLKAANIQRFESVRPGVCKIRSQYYLWQCLLALQVCLYFSHSSPVVKARTMARRVYVSQKALTGIVVQHVWLFTFATLLPR